MATMQQLEDGLRKADAAGNVDDARQFAAAIRAMRDQQPRADFSGVTSRVDSTARTGTALTQADGRPTELGWQMERERQQALREAGADDAASRFGAGVYAALRDVPQGIYQAGIDSALRSTGMASAALRGVGADSVAGALDRNVGAPLAGQSQAARDRVARQRQDEAIFRETPAGMAGQATGTLVSMLGPGITLRGTLPGAMLFPRTVAGNSMLGAVAGATQPYATEGEQAQNAAIGGALGGAGAAVPRAVGAGRSALSRMFDGLTFSERRAGQQIADAATAPLRIESSGVPGVVRPLGEATADPGVSALERLARQRNPEIFVPQDARNNAARMQLIRDMQGTPEARAEALRMRGEEGTQALRDAVESGVNVDTSGTQQLLDSLIEGNRGNSPAQTALANIRAALVPETAPGLAVAEGDVQVLNNIRLRLRDEIDKATRAGDNSVASQLIQVRDALNNEVGTQVPRYTDFLDTYRGPLSREINRADMWEMLGERGRGLPDPTTGERMLTPAGLDTATRDMDRFAQQATGFGRARAEDIFTEADFNALRQLQDDLSRVQFARQAGVAQSNTQGLQAQAARLAGRSALARIPGLGAVTELVERNLNAATQDKLAYLIANPDEAQRVLSRLSSRDAQVLQATLNRLAVTGGAAGRLTAQSRDGGQ